MLKKTGTFWQCFICKELDIKLVDAVNRQLNTTLLQFWYSLRVSKAVAKHIRNFGRHNKAMLFNERIYQLQMTGLISPRSVCRIATQTENVRERTLKIKLAGMP